MDFFEVLIILVFIVIPILEGVLKQRRKGKEEPGEAPAPRQRERERVGAGAGAAGAPSVPPRPAEEGPAADMIPPDLWEVLTGERRTEPPPALPEAPEPAWESEGWETLPEEAPETTDEIATGEVWGSAPWETEWEDSGVRAERGEPESLEYVGPEAISMEEPPPPPEVRHRLFHDKYGVAPALEEGREPGHALRAALQGAELRRAVILAEILGPPKGLA